MFDRNLSFVLAAKLIFATCVSSGFSQTDTEIDRDGAGSATPTLSAFKVPSPPLLDGEILTEELWSRAEPATSFWQTTPNEGQEVTERTEVRVLYTSSVLYVGIICYDREPEEIIVSDSRRDASLEDTDSFQIILDTFHDKQNGFLFGTNPAGIEYDAQITNQGQGRFGGGSGGTNRGSGGFNLNWDGAWEVRAKISDIGWSAEFAIPFRTLRFVRKKTQTWGVNFQRNIRRRKENAYWVKLPRQFNIQRVSLAGSLTGLESISQNNLKVIPYSLTDLNRDYLNAQDTKVDADVGLDAKYSITPSLTLDATYNTDFAQVEVDEQQINLDRFNLFFPEKRPFFLENAGFFSVGSPGEVELFFSRRIGISNDGMEVPILAGGRISGKAGNVNVGLLNMQTEALSSDSLQGNNFAVARLNKELPNRSAIGAIFINRQGTGDLAPDNDYNRTLAVDGRWGLGRYGQVSGYFAKTYTPGVDDDEYAFRMRANYDSEAWRLSTSYSEVGENFNPEVGFVQRSEFRKFEGSIFHTKRVKDFLGLHEVRPHTRFNGFWDFNGFHETTFWHFDSHWEWKNGGEIHTGINLTRQGIHPISAEDDSVFIQDVFIEPGTYDHAEMALVAFTNEGAWWSVRTRVTVGGFFGGDRVSLQPSVRFRVGKTFNTQLSLSHNNIDLPTGSFVTNLFRLRAAYSFTPRLFLQGLVQYNDSSDLWSTNLRLGWLQSANTGLFVVFRDTREEELGVFHTQFRSLVVKYSRLFDLLH